MRPWRVALALPIMAAAVCTTARYADTPAQPVAAERRSSPPVGATEVGLPTTTKDALPAPDFEKDVRPILEKQCRPCHFEGGVMYEKLPFDRAETVRQLGEQLFTRIRDPQEQATIRAFLSKR